MRGMLLRASKVYPHAAEKGFEPGGKTHQRVRGGHANIAEIAGAIACRNVHATPARGAKPRHTPVAIADGFLGCPTGARARSQKQCLVNIVANSLHAVAAERRISE
jgi:hypothetical protein